MSKLTEDYQKEFCEHHVHIYGDIRSKVNKECLHKGIENVVSSAAACLNVLGNLAENHDDLIRFLNCFDLQIQEIIPFPTGANVEGEIYNDTTSVIFEWIGPQESRINEERGSRGHNRTSVDTFILAKIDNKITQVFIEWKFTENYILQKQLQEFAGTYGIERLRRYSSVLAKLRQPSEKFPFNMTEEGGWGMYDLGYEPFYQLFRMTLLARATTPITISNHSNHITVEDYRIVHLSHTENTRLNIVTPKKLKYCPGIQHLANLELHEIWSKHILSEQETKRFKFGYWNEHLDVITDNQLRSYLKERYE